MLGKLCYTGKDEAARCFEYDIAITCRCTLGPSMACEPSGKPSVLLPMLSISRQSCSSQEHQQLSAAPDC